MELSERIRICTAWLAIEDYPLLLGKLDFKSLFYSKLTVFRRCRLWSLLAHVIVQNGLANEDCRHVRMQSTRLRSELRLVPS
jgi:hypothetical protein